jgi:hypothetical protein
MVNIKYLLNVTILIVFLFYLTEHDALADFVLKLDLSSDDKKELELHISELRLRLEKQHCSKNCSISF